MQKVKTLTQYSVNPKGNSTVKNSNSNSNSNHRSNDAKNGSKNDAKNVTNSSRNNSNKNSNDLVNATTSFTNCNATNTNTNDVTTATNNTISSGLLSSFMNTSIILDCIDTNIDMNTTSATTTKSPKYALLSSPSNNNNKTTTSSRNNSKKDNSLKRSNSVIINDTTNGNIDITNNTVSGTTNFTTRTFRPKSAPFVRSISTSNSNTAFNTTEQLQSQWKDSVDAFFQNRLPVESAYTATMNELAQSQFAEYYDNDDEVAFTPLGNVDDHFNSHYRPRTGFVYHVAENIKITNNKRNSKTTTLTGPFSSSTTSRPGSVSNLNLGQRKDTLRSIFCEVKSSDILSPFILKERRKDYPAEFFDRTTNNDTTDTAYDTKNFETQILVDEHIMSDFEDIIEPISYTIDDANYFGEDGKNRFYARSREIAIEHTKSADGHDGHDRLKKRSAESPRTRFIKKYISLTGKLPVPIIIRVDPDAIELDIARKQLKDDYIIALSEVVTELPRLTTVNVCDNNLTDSSMKVLVQSLSNQKQINELDLSENDIDSETAEALLKLIGTMNCPLKVLKLSNADVDDEEIIAFMDAFVLNNSITHLDLSHNHMIDKMFTANMNLHQVLNLNANGCGGAAIASSLYVNSTLAVLDISWNKIGPFSAAHISRALTTTASIIELNLAYNSIKDVGAEAIGMMLFKNNQLKKLNISNNNITAKGCFILAGALRKNDVLNELIIDGNPIGYVGGEYLLQTFNFHVVPRVISLKECLFSDMDAVDHSIFDKDYPCGSYNLDLSLVYDYIVMLELLYIAATRRGCRFASIEYTDDLTRVKTNIKLVRPSNPAPNLGAAYSSWKKGISRGRHPYTNLDALEWIDIVNKLKLIDSATGKIYTLPHHGLLKVEFLYNPRLPTPIECINKTGMLRLMEFLHTHKKDMAHIQKFASSAFKFETFQVHDILESVKEDLNKTEIIYFFMSFVNNILDTSNIYLLIRSHFLSNFAIKEIKLNCRHIYNIMNNSISGHYRLNLANSAERLVAIKLCEINNDEIAYIRRTTPEWKAKDHGYTSQHCGSFFPSNFRNVTFSKASINLDESFFAKGLRDKNIGILEFDYISTSRGSDGVKPIASYDLNALLITRSLHPLEQGLQIAIDPSASNREDMKAKGISMTSLKKGEDRPIIIPVDENSEDYKIWKKHVSILEKFIKRKTKGGLNIATTNFSEYFAMMRQRIGYWLFDIDSLEMLTERLDSAKMIIDKKSRSYMLDEIKNESAMYFIQDRINRFVVRIAIRIHSTNISKVSMIQSKKIAADAMEKVLTKQQENMAKLKNNNGNNNNASGKKQTTPSGANFIKPVFGSIIEPYVAYEQKVDPNDDTCLYVNNGYAPYHQSKDKTPFSSSLCGRVDDFSYQEKPVETEFNSLFSRYKISEDAIMQESELVLKLNVPYWMNTKHIEKYAKQAVVCMFEPFGIDIGSVNITNYYTVDNVDDDIFLPTGLMKSATTLTLTHKFDVKVDKLPFLLNNCIRTSWPSEISVHSAVENAQQVDSTSQVLDDDISKGLEQSQELSQSSVHDVPFRLHDSKNKVIIGWRWRDVNENDYDVLVGHINAKYEQWSNKLMELRTLMGWIWINCIQAKLIVECFSKNAVDGTSPIETAIVTVFNRIVDLENFDIILSALPLANKTSLLNRIGIFNAINFTRIHKINEIELDLRNPECRKLMKIVLELVNSGTISLNGELFKETVRAHHIKGWKLPDAWSSKGVPEVGFITTSFSIKNETDPNVMSKLKRYNKKYCLISVSKLDGNDHHLLDIENNFDNNFT